MNMTKKTLALAVVAASVMVSAPAMADFTGNVGAVSNYLWRGVSQSNDGAAVQGGLDYTAGGFYAGTWASSIVWRTGYEDDLYAGYKFDLSGVTLDVGVIDYTYPIHTTGMDGSFYEGYLGATVGNFSAKVSYGPDINMVKGSKNEAGTYVEAAYTVPVNDKTSVVLHAGNYSGDGVKTVYGSDYSDVSITLTKDAFSFGVTKTLGLNDGKFKAAGNAQVDPNGTRIFVGYKTSLGLL